MNLLTKLGKLLRVSPGEVEAVLRHDEQRARETVSRRRFMGAAAALASAPFVPGTWVQFDRPPMTREEFLKVMTSIAEANARIMLEQLNAAYNAAVINRIVIAGTRRSLASAG